MRRLFILFFKAATLLIGVAALAILIKFPQTEGRAANLDLISIYKDPVIIYIYIASIPFFIALYQALKILGLAGKNKIFSASSINPIKSIKLCALATIAFFVVAEFYMFSVERGKSDDIAGGVAMGLFMILVSASVAITTAIIQRRLQKVT